MKKADIDEDTDIFHLVIMGESASEIDSQFETYFNQDSLDGLGSSQLSHQVSPLSTLKIGEINDVHRMIKNKSKYFKT